MTKNGNLVLRSINQPGETVCVDLFQRPDGSFGFEEYRRDSEDPSQGWFQIGHHGSRVYPSLEDAKQAASVAIQWLEPD